MIVDYSMWRPRAQTDIAGVNGVLRYLSRDGAKILNSTEMGQLHGWGIGTGLVFEDTAQRPTEGAEAGSQDGQFAAAQMRSLGVPHGRPCYAAVDFDIPDYAPGSSSAYAKLGPVAAYLHNFAAELENAGYALGVYGGYWGVTRALDAGLTAWGWQTLAWGPADNGIPRQDHRVRLYQTGVQVFGGNADLNFAGTRDWGQFRREVVWLAGAGA